MKVQKNLAISFLIVFSIFCADAQQKKNVKPPIEKAQPEKDVIEFNEDFEKGSELFQLNQPVEAIPFFEKAIEAEHVDPAIYIYLGIAYYQTEDYTKSLAICVKGLSKNNTNHKILAYNGGNSAYAMANYVRADSLYAIALKEDENYAPAVLNRANAQLKLDLLEDSKNNYIKYLELDGETPQRPTIEQVIALLEQEIERRAKEKPELINPDNFIANEKMETPSPEEIVTESAPKEPTYPKITPYEEKVVRDDVKAPEIPATMYTMPPAKTAKENGEHVQMETLAPVDAVEKQNKKRENIGQRLSKDESAAPELENFEEKTSATNSAGKNSIPSEKVKIKDSELPEPEQSYIPKKADNYKMEKVNDISAPPAPATPQKASGKTEKKDDPYSPVAEPTVILEDTSEKAESSPVIDAK
ncbi:tetratricopeptide repeat protein [Treponema zioleckii]|uniref:tetratricopeptide repeat protein n=1 Tax=Treponema zioleckii TaxID=331680 RepID=UPI00168B8F1A|nr:tetratricopeptide repeat protein [Treponema zioleckii]